jgi:hypothetical protein
MNRTLYAGALAACWLAGCTTTDQANEAMAGKFIGQPTDSFFLSYGPPAASHRLDDGRMMYLWAENSQSLYIPGSTTATVNMVGSTAWVSGWTSPGTTIDIQCQVRIVSRDGRIEQILAHSDSIGWWQLSRCNEVFGRRSSS